MSALLGLLLLLLGCLPCAEARDDESSSVQTHSQPACLSDIHAVLRDMTAVMTEQRTELRHTQQELKAAVDRLQDSESLLKALQVEQSSTQQELLQTQQKQQAAMEGLTDSDRLIKALQVEQSSTQQELRAAMENLTDSDRLIKASVETIDTRSTATQHEVQVLQNRSTATQHEVQVLQKNNEVSRVSFSASLLGSGAGSTGPYGVETILIYRHVFTNVGNGYNPHTGNFIAPVRAVYQFNIFVHGNGGRKRRSGASLYKNGQRVVIAYRYQSRGSGSTSNGVSLLLEAGDVVYVKLLNNAWIYDDRNHHSTFSGHLLFTE